MKRRRRGAVDERIERGTTGLNALGRHLLLEMFDCDPDAINSLEAVKGALIEAAKRAQATIVDVVFHEFNPFGISGVVVIAESHLSIHTWPEYRYAAVDIFSCGDALQPEVAASYLVEQFAAERTSIVEMQRGMFLNSRVPIVNKVTVGVSRPTRRRTSGSSRPRRPSKGTCTPSSGRSWRRRPSFSTSRSWRPPRTASYCCSTAESSPARLTSSSTTRPWFTRGCLPLPSRPGAPR